MVEDEQREPEESPQQHGLFDSEQISLEEKLHLLLRVLQEDSYQAVIKVSSNGRISIKQILVNDEESLLPAEEEGDDKEIQTPKRPDHNIRPGGEVDKSYFG